MTDIDHGPALAAEFAAKRSSWSDIQGHLQTLHDQVAARTEPIVLELGVRAGVSTSAFLTAVSEVGGHVWSVDMARMRTPLWWADTGLWTSIMGDDRSPEIADRLPAAVDVLFIDTSHAYDHTLAELRLYVPRVKPGGVVLLHDTELEHPEGVPADPGFPVAKALDVFCDETDLAWDNRPGSYGLGVIGIPAEVVE